MLHQTRTLVLVLGGRPLIIPTLFSPGQSRRERLLNESAPQQADPGLHPGAGAGRRSRLLGSRDRRRHHAASQAAMPARPKVPPPTTGYVAQKRAEDSGSRSGAWRPCMTYTQVPDMVDFGPASVLYADEMPYESNVTCLVTCKTSVRNRTLSIHAARTPKWRKAAKWTPSSSGSSR